MAEHSRDLDCRGGHELLTTGDMARMSASTLRTVRFYEQEGLIEPQKRSQGGHRLFTRSQLHRLQLALDLREAGVSLQGIKELFCLKAGSECPESATQRMSAVLGDHIDCMQKKIAKLRRLREELASMITVISECNTCEDRTFPRGCDDCDVLENPDGPRALRVLWHD